MLKSSPFIEVHIFFLSLLSVLLTTGAKKKSLSTLVFFGPAGRCLPEQTTLRIALSRNLFSSILVSPTRRPSKKGALRPAPEAVKSCSEW